MVTRTPTPGTVTTAEPLEEEVYPTLLFGADAALEEAVVQVGKPTKHKLNKTDGFVEGKWKAFSAVNVSITNTGTEPLDTSDFWITATTGSRAAAEVFEPGLGNPNVKVLPGKSVRFKTAFGVDKKKPLIVSVQKFSTNELAVFEAPQPESS